MKKELLTLLIIAVYTTSLFSQTEYTKGINRKEYGIQYILPKTILSVQIKAKKTSFTPGEFCKYAERYLKLTNVPSESSTHWEFESAKLITGAVPDSSKIFFVALKDKTTSPLMELTSDGIIKSINITSSINTTANVKEEDGIVDIKDNKLTVDPHSLLTEEILMAGSTAKMAELISKEIYNIRDSRSDLVRGQAENLPKDGSQLKLMLDNLNAQEKALMSMFTGTYSYQEKTITLPVKITEGTNVLFRLSSLLGIVDKNDLSGRPFYLSIQDIKNIKTDTEVNKKLQGVAYNMPGRGVVSLKDGNKKIFEMETPITQFGIIEYLSPILFNKKTITKVQFDPQTGSIIKIDKEEK